MMQRLTILMLLAAASLIAACSRPPSVPEQKPRPQAAATTHRATPLDPLMHDLDRAKAVQGTVDAHARAQRKAIEQQTQ